MNTVPNTPDHSDNPPPRVSVVIPAYCSAAFIAETLDSVFAQTFSDFEVIVVNDGSPDTAALEVALRPYANRLRYLKQENKGPSAARNAGIRNARGEFVAFLDSDDIWLPDYLRAQVRFLENHPQADASISDAVRFGEGAGETTWTMLKNGGSGVLTFDEMLQRQGGQIPSASVARRLRAIEVAMFDESLRYAEDLEFFLRICFPDRAVGYPGKVLMKYRQRPGSLTSDPGNRRWRVAEIEALRRLGQKLALSESQRKILNDEIAAADAAIALADAYQHLSENAFADAVQCFRTANTYYRDPRITVACACLNAFPRLAGQVLKWRWRERSRRENQHP